MPRKKKTTKTNAILSAFGKVQYPIVDVLMVVGLVVLMVFMIYLK